MLFDLRLLPSQSPTEAQSQGDDYSKAMAPSSLRKTFLSHKTDKGLGEGYNTEEQRNNLQLQIL